MKSNDAPLMPLPDHADATPGAGAKGEVVKGRSFFRKGGRLLLGAGLLSLACLLGVFSLALLIVRIDPFPRGPAAPTFEEKHPTVGEAAPDFTLKDLQGEPYHLRERLGQRPLVIEFGSLTWTCYTSQFGSLDDLARRYAGKVDFVFIYCQEGHPAETVPVHTYGERQAQAQKFCRVKKAQQKMLVDEFGEQSVQDAYDAYGASAFVLDKNGRVAAKLAVGRPDDLEDAVRACLGEPPVVHEPPPAAGAPGADENAGSLGL